MVRQRVGVDFTDSDPFWCDPVTAQGQGNLAVVMGPLEGVQDVLGVSQSTASTSAKDRELLLPAFRIFIPLQIKLKKKFPGLFMDHKKKNLEHETNRFLLEQVGRKTQELRGNI